MIDTTTMCCRECGMPVKLGEYHPHAACLMYRGCADAEQVRAALNAVKRAWFDLGKRQGLRHD